MYMGYAHGYFAFPKLEGEIGPHMTFRGQKMLNWSLNNYLGLANHPEVREADAKGAAEFGMAAPMGARMMSGQTKYHEQLERELAEFVGKPDAFLLNFGYQGMISIIDCLLTPRDVVVYARRFRTGAILWVIVPATMMKSAWRGEARATSNPNRAKS